MPVRIVLEDALAARVPVTCEPFRIGSDPAMDLVLKDPRVASRHAKLGYRNGEYVLSDVDGVIQVNGSTVPFMPLRTGDRVVLTTPEDARPLAFTFDNRMEDAFVPPGTSVSEAWLAHPASADPQTGPLRFSGGEPLDDRPLERLRLVDDGQGTRTVVKVLGPVKSAEDADRLLRLVAALSGARHPGMASTVDGGVARTGDAVVRWMAAAYVAGRPATASIQVLGLDAAHVALILEPIASALAHLHERGVVHRDVAPSNVIVGPGGATLIDFGQSIVVEHGADVSRGVIGTPGYLAPEEVVEGGARITPAVDVYGLAAVGYALLTGSPPATGSDLLEILSRSLATPPTPRALGFDVPDALETAIVQALDPDPLVRPTARAFGRACAFARVQLGLGGPA